MTPTSSLWNPYQMASELAEEFCPQNTDPQGYHGLKQTLESGLDQAIRNAFAWGVEPDLVEAVIQLNPEADEDSLFLEILQNSPGAQKTVKKAVEDFVQRIWEGHETSKKKA